MLKKLMDVFNVVYLKDAQLYLYAMIHMQRHKHLEYTNDSGEIRHP